ncbi:phage portal protein [Orbus wheelerorum]|uniref:phage portal protein n=1 Tax=Orbus wheelerorum TaxID=3074111 RepID=UPI00370DD646
MSKLSKKQNKKNNKPMRMSSIAFERPEVVLTDLSYYYGTSTNHNSDCYPVPVERLALSQLPNINPQHGGIVQARRNMLLSTYLSGGLTKSQAMAWFYDFIVFGDAYLLKMRNVFGHVIGLVPLMSLYVKAKKNEDETAIEGFIVPTKKEAIFYNENDIIQIKMPDPTQQVYGLPDYLGGVNSAMLNSESTMFRRRYYNNGAHMGYIFYTNDPSMTDEMEEAIRAKIENSKGVGNFKNMFVSIPGGTEKAIQLIPVGDLNSAKDEFANIKNISAQDLLNAHRFPAGLAGVIPANGSNNGDVTKSRKNYMATETKVLQDLISDAVNNDEDIKNSPKKSDLILEFQTITMPED